jgi:hypothetical protein
MKRFLIVVDFEAVCNEPVEVEVKEIIGIKSLASQLSISTRA